jgi:hypothetical protein
MILSTQELRLITRDMLRLLPERAAIQRASETVDRSGGAQRAYTTIATEVPCRVAPVTAGYTPSLEQVRVRGSVSLVFPRDLDIQVGDIILLGERQYRVTELSELGTLGLLRQVTAEVMQ